MKFVDQSKEFKRDLKKLASSKYRGIVNNELRNVVGALANDEALDYSYHDHPLTGNLKGFRECHLAFDLVLVYQVDENKIRLSRIGSHSVVLGL